MLPITLSSDFEQRREFWVESPEDYLDSYSLSNNGEKLALAFLAGSVPIYWGPATDHIFANESYIRCSDDLEECARRVKQLDGDDLLYERLRTTQKVTDLSILQASSLKDDLIARLQPKFVLRYPPLP